MPILKQETSLFPNDLLAQAEAELSNDGPLTEESPRWWAMYTRSRQEKQLMRKLEVLEVAFCCPTIERRYRSKAGRIRRVYDPLFSNYVFVYGNVLDRYAAQTTNCISQCRQVSDGLQLTQDLAHIQRLIETGEPLSREARLVAGDLVRVKTGKFASFEGVVTRRQGKSRLIVAVNFMQQGASVELDDCQLEYLAPASALVDAPETTKGSIDVVYNPR